MGKSPRTNEIFQVPIESVNKEGFGVTTIEWDTMQKQIEPSQVTVRGALPGETVRVRVVSVFSIGGSAIHTVRLVVFGRREHLIRPRTDNESWRSSIEDSLLPPGHEESRDYEPFGCPHFDRRHDEEACRGCSVPHLNYTRQVAEKTKLLKQSLLGAVDDSILSNLQVEPRTQITRFANKFEIFAFSKRPLGIPVWGQLSWKDPLPGERRDKHFVATPECRLISKSATVVLNRMAKLIEALHEEHGSMFAVHNEVINRGSLRSAVVQTCKDKNDANQVLLSIVTACETSQEFRKILQSQVADRLMAEFPLLKGVNLIEPDGGAGAQIISLAGTSTITEYIPSVDLEIPIGPNSPKIDFEVKSKLFSALANTLGDVRSNDRIMEILGPYESPVSKLLSDVSVSVHSLSESHIQTTLEQGTNQLQLLPIPSPAEVSDKVAVITFPQNSGKAQIKGVTSKEFRHWLGNVVKPKRIVIITDRFDGLRKDIGHMKLLGYEIRSIKAVDSQPGVMDKIATIVVLQQKPTYQELSKEQLIEE